METSHLHGIWEKTTTLKFLQASPLNMCPNHKHFVCDPAHHLRRNTAYWTQNNNRLCIFSRSMCLLYVKSGLLVLHNTYGLSHSHCWVTVRTQPGQEACFPSDKRRRRALVLLRMACIIVVDVHVWVWFRLAHGRFPKMKENLQLVVVVQPSVHHGLWYAVLWWHVLHVRGWRHSVQIKSHNRWCNGRQAKGNNRQEIKFPPSSSLQDHF